MKSKPGRKKILVGGVLIGVIVLAGMLAPWLATVDPNAQQLGIRFQPPVWTAKGTLAHPLGTDDFGRDVMSRLMHGARISMVVGLASVVLSAGVGIFVGLIAATGGRRVDQIIQMLIDAQSALPPVLLAIIFAAALGPSTSNVVIVLGITGWSLFARVVYAQTLTLRERDYVAAAIALGAGQCEYWPAYPAKSLGNAQRVDCFAGRTHDPYGVRVELPWGWNSVGNSELGRDARRCAQVSLDLSMADRAAGHRDRSHCLGDQHSWGGPQRTTRSAYSGTLS